MGDISGNQASNLKEKEGVSDLPYCLMQRAFLASGSMKELLQGVLEHLPDIYEEFLEEHVLRTFRDVLATERPILYTWLFLILLNRELSVQQMTTLTQEDGGKKLQRYLCFLTHQTLAMRNTPFEVDNIVAIIEQYVECCRDVWLHNDFKTMDRFQHPPNENKVVKPGDKRKKKGKKRMGKKNAVTPSVLMAYGVDGWESLLSYCLFYCWLDLSICC